MKTHISVIFGGQSAEHEISILSAKSVIQNLDREKYQVHPIYVDKSGMWYLLLDCQQLLRYPQNQALELSLFSYKPVIINTSNFELKEDTPYVFNQYKNNKHVVIPLIHGPKGEDGSLQGLLEYCDCAYVGSSVLSSAITMNKGYFKDLLVQYNVPTMHYIIISKDTTAEQYMSQVSDGFQLPVFVKPCSMGSSIGITKVNSLDQLKAAIQIALRYDEEVIIEQGVIGREFECAVLGNELPHVSCLGEIISKNEFYDYNAKYIDNNAAETIIPAEIADNLITKVQHIVKEIYIKFQCSGMARVDLFIDNKNTIYINELNSIPGFTSISLYPKLWEYAGKSFSNLLDELIDCAEDRYNRKKNLLSDYYDIKTLQLVE